MFIRILFLSILVTGFAAAQQASRFDQWDRDKNGKLSKDELPQQLRKNFERVDKDGDGWISRAEDAAVMGVKKKGDRSIAGLKKTADIDYVGDGNSRQMLDLYLPENPKTKQLPVVVWIHGGGWRKGDKRNFSRVAPLVQSAEFAGVSIGYRLTDEASWPAQVHDCKAAIRWIRANGAKHGLDTNRIAVWGSSAGGHLVAMLGVSHDVAELEGELGPHTDQSTKVSCVVNYFGPAELLKMDEQGSTLEHNAPDSPEGLLVGGAIQENKEIARQASPITHVSTDDAPMLLVHGTKDPLVPYQQSVDLEKALKEAGVDAKLITVENGGHGSGFGPEIAESVRQYLTQQLK